MKVKAKALILAGILSVYLALPTMAAPTLGEVTNGNTTAQEQEDAPFNGSGSGGVSSNNGNSSNVGENDAISALSNSVDVSGENETVRNIQNAAKEPFTIVFQLMAYAITMGLTLRVLCDLTYITIPPLRGILSGGKQGNPGNAQGQGGMGMGGMSGGMGMGGYGGGMSSYGGGMGMGGMSGGMGMGGQQQPQGAGTCWVSQAAMDSVVAIDPTTGRAGNAYKVYAKDMAVTCTLTAVLLVLALTGVLQQLGFMLGSLISNGIGSML